MSKFLPTEKQIKFLERLGSDKLSFDSNEELQDHIKHLLKLEKEEENDEYLHYKYGGYTQYGDY